MRGVFDIAEFDVSFYAKADGTKPAREFILSLDAKMKAKITRTILMLEINGTELREPYSKHLRDGIFELRVKVGSNISRVLYFFVVGHHAVLTHGFVKKTDDVPSSEIEKAIKYRFEYLSRKEKKE